MTSVVKDDCIQIEKLELGPFGTNAYILVCRNTAQSVVVDAPADAGKILQLLKETSPRYILITHNHMDHTGALSDLKSALGVPIAAHPADAGRLPVSADQLLNDGDVVSIGDLKLSVLHTPGHTPGSVSVLLTTGDAFVGCMTHNNLPFRLKPGLPIFAEDIPKLKESWRILLDEGARTIHPGHGNSFPSSEILQFI